MKALSKHSKAAPAATVNESAKIVLSSDPAIEALLAEIASTAYLTERRLRLLPADVNTDATSYEAQIDELRFIVARVGWMADIALQRLGSINTMCNGHAEQWLLTPTCAEALLTNWVQS